MKQKVFPLIYIFFCALIVDISYFVTTLIIDNRGNNVDFSGRQNGSLSASVTKNRPLMYGGHEIRNPSFSQFFVK